jgi:hypothetical protein
MLEIQHRFKEEEMINLKELLFVCDIQFLLDVAVYNLEPIVVKFL